MTTFSQALVGHHVERISEGLATMEGAVLRAISEAQPPVRFDAQPVSPLVADLLELRSVLVAWHQRLKERRTTSATQARIERNTRRPR